VIFNIEKLVEDLLLRETAKMIAEAQASKKTKSKVNFVLD